jgi:hypothetical protein
MNKYEDMTDEDLLALELKLEKEKPTLLDKAATNLEKLNKVNAKRDKILEERVIIDEQLNTFYEQYKYVKLESQLRMTRKRK